MEGCAEVHGGVHGGVQRCTEGHRGVHGGAWRGAQRCMEGCTEVHGVAQRGAQRCVEGCTEVCFKGPSLFVLSYHWLTLATIDLVGDNREFEA